VDNTACFTFYFISFHTQSAAINCGEHFTTAANTCFRAPHYFSPFPSLRKNCYDQPYTDPNDREDRTLSRITPLLIEIAREGYNDIPSVLRQFKGMDADEIAAEHDRRIAGVREARERRARRGLGAFSTGGGALPPPELSPEPEKTTGAPTPPQQLSSKDIVGAAPESENMGGGVIGWFNKRQKEQEEEQMRKMEKWNEHMMKKQKEREDRAQARA